MPRSMGFRNSGAIESQHLLVAGLVVIIGLALGGVIYKAFSGGGDSIKVPKEYHVKCIEPECGEEWAIPISEWGKYDRENPAGEDCPKCGAENSVFGMIKCPKCGTYYLPKRIEDPDAGKDARDVCPKCGTDLREYWKKNRGR